MRSPLRRIIFVFVILALLPVVLVFYEFNQLEKNENIVREAYQNQLEAILFSVNQYTDDVLSNWASRVRQHARENSGSGYKPLTDVIIQTDVVRGVYFTNLNDHSEIHLFNNTDPDSLWVQHYLDSVVSKNLELCQKLVNYSQAGFQKVVSLEQPVFHRAIPVLFALDDTTTYKVGILIVDLPKLVSDNLAPKMQQVAQGKMNITVFRTLDDSIVFSTYPDLAVRPSSAEILASKGTMAKKDIWVLPGYYLAISLIGVTLDELIADRNTTTILLFSTVGVLLLAGIYFLYSNVKRELYLSQAKSEFVSNVSHEIRTPLSLIGMFAETLETGRVTTEAKKQEYYSIISKETARLSRIVNRILNFSQLEANKKTFLFAPVQLNDICSELLKMYFFPLSEKGFVFEYFPDEHLKPVHADKEAVSEVIVNLLDNAVKYSRENKQITVRTGVEGAFTFVSVQDRGIGIARNHQKEIFEQFFRAPTGDVHNTKGSGLGLTLVKKIMEAHRGQVRVSSTPGVGSTFTLLFPSSKQEK